MNENIIYEYEEVSPKLVNYIKETKSLHKFFKKDWDALKARQYCGIIHYAGEDFCILPKISNNISIDLDIFTYMLMYSYDIKLHNEDISSAKNEKSDSILEVFIQMFAKRLFQEFGRGVYKEYKTEQEYEANFSRLLSCEL